MMDKGSDNYWMSKAFELAIQGKSRTQPNPLVGCVIVHEGKIIGEGYHHSYGKNHAEVEAFNGLENFDGLENATAYINLEPCSHFGNTPPCAEFLVKSKIGRVVTAMEDPNPNVKGSGHSILKENNIELTECVLENEAKELNRIFIHLQKSPLPYITLKWAQSSDGYIDPEKSALKGRGSVKISSDESSILVQSLRSQHNSILIGKNTAFVDAPLLTSREEGGVDPIRIVIDSKCELNTNHFDIVVCNSDSNSSSKQCKGLENGLESILVELRKMGVFSILVEGGAHTLNQFINSDLWNEAYVFESPKKLSNGLKAPTMEKNKFEKSMVGIDTLYHKIR